MEKLLRLKIFTSSYSGKLQALCRATILKKIQLFVKVLTQTHNIYMHYCRFINIQKVRRPAIQYHASQKKKEKWASALHKITCNASLVPYNTL